jgi:two-component system cell cycle response regulator
MSKNILQRKIPMRILIADDEITSRAVLAGVLSKEDHEVTVTVNGAEAWQALKQPDAPQLAILDWMMPELDGLEVVRRVRAMQTDRPPYIIMLTIKDDKADIITGLKAGANDYLSKPFDAGELRARVEVGRRMVEMQDALVAKIGELRESEKRYRELSIIDDLTQLYNSRHFYFQLKIELDRSNRYGQPLTLLLLDLDNFKAFNDAYGHVEGDNVLSRLGQVVKRCLRQPDSAYRYGGEEFTILLPMTTSADGAVTAERIRTEFKKETFSTTPGQDANMTVSIGVAQYRPQEAVKAFVHRADKLMYQGKKNGKDSVCCET